MSVSTVREKKKKKKIKIDQVSVVIPSVTKLKATERKIECINNQNVYKEINLIQKMLYNTSDI